MGLLRPVYSQGYIILRCLRLYLQKGAIYPMKYTYIFYSVMFSHIFVWDFFMYTIQRCVTGTKGSFNKNPCNINLAGLKYKKHSNAGHVCVLIILAM